MKNKSAVEWLEKAFYSYAESTGINNNKWLIDEEDLDKLLEQAKEMEKEQIIDAHNIGRNDKHNDFDREGEQYYNETFKSE
jgi:inorganic pyrophosphatase/exopolyphosphatase